MREWINIVVNNGKKKLNEQDDDLEITYSRLGKDRRGGRVGTAEPREPQSLDIEMPTSRGELTRGNNTGVSGTNRPSAPTTRVADRSRTRSSMRGMPGGDMSVLSDVVGREDEISDEEAARHAGHDAEAMNPVGRPRPEPRTPENLPAVIRNDLLDLSRKGDDSDLAEFDPEWHMVKHLPGYMSSGIRAMGREIFKVYFDIPIEKVQILSTMTNPGYDVKKMAAIIDRYGIKEFDDKLEFPFRDPMGGGQYQPLVRVYSWDGNTFMLVRDSMGEYIYAAPTGRGTSIETNADSLKIAASRTRM